MPAAHQKGSILVTTAVCIVILMAVLGLAIDLGVLYTARTYAQRAADAGALAGAYSYELYPDAPQPLVTQLAQQTAEQNKILGASLIASDIVVTFPAANRVVVHVTKSIPTFFIKVLGNKWAQVPISATATAEAATAPSGSTCLRPFWVTKSYLLQQLGYSCSNQPTDWSSLPSGTTLKLWDSNVASQWGLISPPPNYPTSDLTSWIPSCNAVVMSCQSQLNPENGATVGNIRRPLQDLIGQQGATVNWFWQDAGEYIYDPNTPYTAIPSGPVVDSSPAVITMAVWDDCSGPAPAPGQPGQQIPIGGFTQIFVQDVGTSSGKGIDARFISMTSACGVQPGGSGPGVPTGPGAIPIRLINPN